MTDISEIFVPALEADATLLAGLPGGIHQASSLGVGDAPQVPERKYLVWNEVPSAVIPGARETSNAQTRTFYFWVYDDPGDYTGITNLLREVKRVCKTLEYFSSGDLIVLGFDWLGLSGLFPADPAYHVISRYGSARFAVNQ